MLCQPVSLTETALANLFGRSAVTGGDLCSRPDDDALQALAGEEPVPDQQAGALQDQQTQTGAEDSTTGVGDAEADDEDFESFKKKHEEEEALSAMTANVEEGVAPRKCSSCSSPAVMPTRP